MALTVRKIVRLISASVKGRHTDGVKGGGVRGLMLEIQGKQSAHWMLRFQINKKTYWMGFGSALDIARTDGKAGARLAAVRKRALQAREQIAAGVNPLELKRDQRAAASAASARKLTFKQASERCFEAKQGEWSSDRYRDEFISSLQRWVWPLIGGKDVADVAKDDLLRILEQKLPENKLKDGKKKADGTFWKERTITADRTRNRIETILNWAEARGFRPAGIPNPARWKGSLSELLGKPRKLAPVKSMASVPYPQVPGVMEALSDRETVAAKALAFLILSASRMSEVIEAEWTEFENLETGAAQWRIPASRMKARREHIVPLSPQAVALLKSLPREEGNPFVFISSAKTGTNVTETTVAEVLNSIGRSEVPHGFRSSFRTWAGDCTSFHRPEIELSLAHKIGSAVEETYNKAQMLAKRRRLIEAWATYCCTPLARAAEANVVPIRAS
jgi:integrase